MTYRREYAVSYLLLGTGVLAYTHFLPQVIGYAAFLAAVVITGIIGIMEDGRIAATKASLLGLFVVLGVQTMHLIVSMPVAARDAVRPATHIIGALVLVLILPRIVRPRVFYRATTRTALVVVAIGLPVLFVGDIGPMQAWEGRFFPIPGVPWKAPMLRSVLFNPNQVAIISSIGAIAALHEYFKSPRYAPIVEIGVLFVGMWLTTGRASMLVFAAASIIVVAGHTTGPRSTRGVAIALVIVGAGGLVWLYYWSGISLSGRRVLWAASYQAFLERPVFGYGAGNTADYIAPYVSVPKYLESHTHNAYLRIALTSGVVGLVGYLVAFGSAFMNSLGQLDVEEGCLVLAIVVGIGVDQVFESFSIFGFSVTSLIAAATLGYGITIYKGSSRLESED